MTGRTLTKVKRTEPWQHRLIRSLLYGRNVDRAAKARARVGLAILAFALVYAILAGRLVMFAVGADSHGARRTAQGRCCGRHGSRRRLHGLHGRLAPRGPRP